MFVLFKKRTAFESAFQTRSFHIRLVAMLTIQSDAAAHFLLCDFFSFT